MFQNKVRTKGEGKPSELDSQGQDLDKHWYAWQDLQTHPAMLCSGLWLQRAAAPPKTSAESLLCRQHCLLSAQV